MPIELKVPAVGEAISEVEIGEWLKAKGEFVAKDEPVVTLESEKATVELPAPIAGVIAEMLKKKGDIAKIGEVIGFIDKDGAPTKTEKSKTSTSPATEAKQGPVSTEPRVRPAAQRLMAERGIKSEDVKPSGPGGRVLKEDVLRVKESAPSPVPSPPVGEM